MKTGYVSKISQKKSYLPMSEVIQKIQFAMKDPVQD